MREFPAKRDQGIFSSVTGKSNLQNRELVPMLQQSKVQRRGSEIRLFCLRNGRDTTAEIVVRVFGTDSLDQRSCRRRSGNRTERRLIFRDSWFSAAIALDSVPRHRETAFPRKTSSLRLPRSAFTQGCRIGLLRFAICNVGCLPVARYSSLLT